VVSRLTCAARYRRLLTVAGRSMYMTAQAAIALAATFVDSLFFMA
jgi:hypothetical protein